jgi:transcription elongation factor Elf1
MKLMLENTEGGAIKNGQAIETGYIVQTRRRKTKQKHNTIRVGHHCMQTNTDMRPPTNNPELDIKTNRTSFICGNCNGHHITSYQVYKENWVKQMLN